MKISKNKPTAGEAASPEKIKKEANQPAPIKFKKGEKPGELKATGESEEQFRQMLTQAFGTSDYDSQMIILNQVAHTFGVITSSGIIDDQAMVTACTQVVKIMCDIKPQNAIERLLVSQMVGVHAAVMKALQYAMLPVQTSQGVEANINRATKLMRTFTSQIETLKRYRTGGQQKMTVEHVHVHSGGQAIVGEVHNEGGGNKK